MIRVYCCEEHTLKYMLQNQKAEERKVNKTISMSSHWFKGWIYFRQIMYDELEYSWLPVTLCAEC